MSYNPKTNPIGKMAELFHQPEFPLRPPEGCSIEYVGFDNVFMRQAFIYAREYSKDKNMPTGAVLVKNGEIIGHAANGSDYHDKFGCERVRRGIQTGERYDLCEGCHTKNHSEPRVTNDAIANNYNTNGAVLYLWGHWWCCEPCWEAMIKAGITQVCLVEGSEVLFNREEEGNVVGTQIEHFNQLLSAI